MARDSGDGGQLVFQAKQRIDMFIALPCSGDTLKCVATQFENAAERDIPLVSVTNKDGGLEFVFDDDWELSA